MSSVRRPAELNARLKSLRLDRAHAASVAPPRRRQGQALLPSRVVPDFPVPVEQFFA